MNDTIIYKVMSRSQWEALQTAGQFDGAAIDLQDGFIHLSAAAQLVETVAKHFHGQPDLVVVAVDVASLGTDLRWEVSRGGALFPHLYGTLRLASVTETFELPMNAQGQHQFPAGPWKSTD
jgi:uncharacterized protein (DUF952 family)